MIVYDRGMDAGRIAPVVQNVGALVLSIVAMYGADQSAAQPIWLVALALVAGWLVKDPAAIVRWVHAARQGKALAALQRVPDDPAPRPVDPDDLTPVESLGELERVRIRTIRPPGP